MKASLILLTVALSQAPTLPDLTLEAAMQRAREHNQDLKAAQARLDQARELHRKAWALYLPTLAAGASYTRNSESAEIQMPTRFWIRELGPAGQTMNGPPFDPTQRPSSENPPGAPATSIVVPSGLRDIVLQKEDQVGLQLTVSQPLIVPSLWPAIQNAYLAERVVELNVENARREVLFAVAQVYYGAASLKEVIEVHRQLVAMTERHERDAQARFKAGMLPEIGVVRAQLDRVRAEQELLQAQNAYASARLALATLLDRDPGFEVVRPAEPGIPADLANGEDVALRDRPDVRAAQGALELTERSHRAVWFRYAPNVALSAAYRLANVTGFTDRYSNWAVTVGLSWTLWDGGLRESELRETEAKVAEATAGLRSLENRAREEVRRAVLDLESVRANRKKAQEQLALARRNQKLIEANHSAGMATQLEVADATAALRNAEVGEVAETLKAQLAALRLLKALGAFETS